MRLFPEKAKMQALMKKGLPVIFAVAWTPVVWMLMTAILGNAMERMIGSWQPVVAILGLTTIAVMSVLVIAFRRYGLKIFDEKGV